MKNTPKNNIFNGRKIANILPLSLLILLLPVSAYAIINKCLNKDRLVVFTNYICPESYSEELQVKPNEPPEILATDAIFRRSRLPSHKNSKKVSSSAFFRQFGSTPPPLDSNTIRQENKYNVLDLSTENYPLAENSLPEDIHLSYLELTPNKYGRYTFIGSINNVPAKLLIDTGSSFPVVLSRSALATFNIPLHKRDYQRVYTIGGGSNNFSVELDSLQIHETVFANVRATVLDGYDASEGVIIGMPVLAKMKMRKQGKKLFLADSRVFSEILPALESGHKPVAVAAGKDGRFYIDGTVNKRKVKFLLDTGAPKNFLYKSFARYLGIFDRDMYDAGYAHSPDGTVMTRYKAVIRTMEINQRVFNNIEVTLLDKIPKINPHTVVLGWDFLQMLNFEIRGNELMLHME